MAGHNGTVADCPNCKRLDYVEREDNHWICLNCGYSSEPHPHRAVADCPKCGKRDFIEEETNRWRCMSCSYYKDLFKSEEDNPIWPTILAIIIVLILLSV